MVDRIIKFLVYAAVIVPGLLLALAQTARAEVDCVTTPIDCPEGRECGWDPQRDMHRCMLVVEQKADVRAPAPELEAERDCHWFSIDCGKGRECRWNPKKDIHSCVVIKADEAKASDEKKRKFDLCVKTMSRPGGLFTPYPRWVRITCEIKVETLPESVDAK